MSFGKGGGTSITTAELSPEQRQDIATRTDIFKNTIAPAYQQTIQGAKDIYNQSAAGVTGAGQNLARVAGQAQDVLGSVGESGVRTGISGLENLFNADYEQQQLQAAMAPAQAQYQQNLAGLGAQYGGAGQIGSARQALANTQLAGQTQAAQQQAAAGVLKDIQAGRLAAGQALAGYGQSALGQALGAAGQGVTAAKIPMDQFAQLASIYYGVPQQSYTPDFRGTQGSSTTSNQSKFGISI